MSSAVPRRNINPQPNRAEDGGSKHVHIADMPMTRTNWYRHFNWLNIFLILVVPLYGIIQAFWVPLQWKTGLWAFAYYFMTGLGITAGNCLQCQILQCPANA